MTLVLPFLVMLVGLWNHDQLWGGRLSSWLLFLPFAAGDLCKLIAFFSPVSLPANGRLGDSWPRSLLALL